jgi:ribosomal protein L34E
VQDADATCRRRAAQALAVVMRREVGALKAIAASAVPVTLTALFDSDRAVQRAIMAALCTGCVHQSFRQALAEALAPGERSAVAHVLALVKKELPSSKTKMAEATEVESADKLAVQGLELLSKLAHVRPIASLTFSRAAPIECSAVLI